MPNSKKYIYARTIVGKRHPNAAPIPTAREHIPPLEHWPLTFKPVGEGPPTEIRIRRLLKFALRSCGLKCCGYEKPLERKKP